MSSPNQTFLEKMFPRNSKQKSLRHWADSLRLAFLLSPVKFRPLLATCAASPFGLPTLLL